MVRLIIDLFQTGTVHLKHFRGLILEDGKYIFIDAVPAVFRDKDEVILKVVQCVTVTVCFQVHKKASDVVEPNDK